MSETRTQVWSCGGGTQSAAIAALIVQGRLPKPDIAVISDTEREKQSTWDYLDSVLRPALAPLGVEIVRIKKGDWATEDVWKEYGENPDEKPGVLLPVFVNSPGDEGRLITVCSGRWKRRPVQRWLRAQGVKQCDVWLGMSLDEMKRVRASGELWYQHRYPLVFEVPLRRGECIRLVTDEMKWPEPPRSSCWMCPNHGDGEWGRIKREFPGEFAKAVQFEREMQAKRPDFFLHRSCVALDLIDFTDNQMLLGDNTCDTGHCFT